ncbi:MAG: hypothetical protein IKD58_03805 [Loktanella sp.]|nr:hypothetical protein [Loktanella sp.]
MPRMTIDGITCHTEDLCDQGRATAASLQFLDRRMQQIRLEIQVYQTAQAAYAQALAAQLAAIDDALPVKHAPLAPT